MNKIIISVGVAVTVFLGEFAGIVYGCYVTHGNTAIVVFFAGMLAMVWSMVSGMLFIFKHVKG